jgi:hypothetical protein
MNQNSAAVAYRSEQIEKAQVQAHIALLQKDVSHIRADIAGMKTDIRELLGKTDAANEAIFDRREEVALKLMIALNAFAHLITAGVILGVLGRALKVF